VRDFDTPAAATLLGKSVFPELHPAYLGVHESRWGSSTYATTSQ
jgi:TPP-dependent 2-oxoacid decarboxylase